MFTQEGLLKYLSKIGIVLVNLKMIPNDNEGLGALEKTKSATIYE